MAGQPPTVARWDWSDHDPYILNLVNQAFIVGELAPGGLATRLAKQNTYYMNGPVQTVSMCGVLKRIVNQQPAFVRNGTYRSAVAMPSGGPVGPFSRNAVVTPGNVLFAVIQALNIAGDFGLKPLGGPAGWIELGRVTALFGTPVEMSLWGKLAGGAEPASYSWTIDVGATSGQFSGGILEYSGVDGTNFFESPGVVCSWSRDNTGNVAYSGSLVGPYPPNAVQFWWLSAGGVGVALANSGVNVPSFGTTRIGDGGGAVIEATV